MTDPRESLPKPEESPFWQALGIKTAFENDEAATAPDIEKLRRYYSGALGEAEREEVRTLVGRYRSWYVALGEIVRDRGQGSD